MDIRQLRTFVTVAQLSSVTKAAEALHITQPAVSGQLKALEDELQVRLLSRTTSSDRPRRALAPAESSSCHPKA